MMDKTKENTLPKLQILSVGMVYKDKGVFGSS